MANHLSPRLYRTACAFAALSLVSATTAAPQPSDAPPVDTEAVMKALRDIQEKNETTLRSALQKAINDFRNAGALPSRAVDLYEDATKATEFAGRNLQQTQFQEWKKKQADRLRSSDLQEAAQLHLQYLALSLEHSAKVPMEKLIPALMQYTERVYNAKEETFRHDLMRKPINSSIFARWYGVASFLQKLKGWEMTPSNADGIWEKTILPELREAKDMRAVHYWDQRIARADERLAKTRQEFAHEQFNTIERPVLLWKRAEELNGLGLRNHAINEMLAIIKKYPTHPENANWITQLTNLLKPATTGEIAKDE